MVEVLDKNVLALDAGVIGTKLMEYQNSFIELCILEHTFPETNSLNDFTKKIVSDYDKEREVLAKELNDCIKATPINETLRTSIEKKLEELAYKQRPFIQATKQLDRQLEFIQYDKAIKLKAMNFLGRAFEEKRKALTK
jgi:signal transduction histidine kinase